MVIFQNWNVIWGTQKSFFYGHHGEKPLFEPLFLSVIKAHVNCTVYCSAQSSWGLKGTSVVVLRALYIHSPHLHFLAVRESNSQPLDYESNSLTIKPRLPVNILQ